METVKTSPVLKALSKTGKTKCWRLHIVKEKEKYFTSTEYWQEGDNGESKHQFSEPYPCTPKNIGKANATTSEEQAYKEFESIIKLQRDQGYNETVILTNVRPLPMLAKIFENRKQHLNWPIAGQPKLDGTRSCFNSDVSFWSRKGKDYIPEVVEHLLFDTKGYTFDGEIMIPHGDASFQESISAIKKYRDISRKLKYYIYDVILPDVPFKERHEIIKSFKFPGTIVVVETVNLKTENDFLNYHRKCVKNGYEGSMGRSWNGLYLINQRSNDLLKHKDFVEEEFVIVDITEGSGSHKGVAKFICKTETDELFEANPEGTLEVRKEYFENKKKYIGGLLTVKFQEYTDRGVPRFPVAKGVRNYE